MQLAISTYAGISHCAANTVTVRTVPVRTVALLRVRPDTHVRLLLMTEGPGSVVRPSDLKVPPRPPATPPGFVAYLGDLSIYLSIYLYIDVVSPRD